MEYMIVSRDEIEAGVVVKTPYVVISICDPGKRAARLKRPPHCLGVLQLRFHDAEPTSAMSLPPEIRLMTEKQADQIAKFVTEHKDDIGTILVHCEQGMSRSPAVAAAICAGLGDDNTEILNTYQPNQFVYDMAREAFEKSANPVVDDRQEKHD
jgi:predicted protein tyrosine phosphatase